MDSAAHDLLTGAVAVHVGGVEEIGSAFDYPLDDRPGLILGQTPAPLSQAEAHTAETDARDLEAGASNVDVIQTRFP
jgi:hypothetical protein